MALLIDLTNKVVLITGGSQGIAAATAKLFAKAGANIAIACRGHDGHASEVTDEIKKLGRRAKVYKGDIAKKSGQDNCRRRFE